LTLLTSPADKVVLTDGAWAKCMGRLAQKASGEWRLLVPFAGGLTTRQAMAIGTAG